MAEFVNKDISDVVYIMIIGYLTPDKIALVLKRNSRVENVALACFVYAFNIVYKFSSY